MSFKCDSRGLNSLSSLLPLVERLCLVYVSLFLPQLFEAVVGSAPLGFGLVTV